MSQDNREKFGVKTQISIGGGGGGGGGARKERKDMLRAGQSRGSIVCVYGVMHYKTCSPGAQREKKRVALL